MFISGKIFHGSPPADAAYSESAPGRRATGLLISKGAMILLAACVSLALLVGDIGFQGDDWWIFSFPFWNPYPEAVWQYAAAAKRPIEGLYWITAFELFGFHRVPYLFLSLLLLACSSACFGLCLLRSFPGQRDFALSSMFFSFLLPPVANLAFMIHTDNSRISTLLFWACVLAYQSWTAKRGQWKGLILPVLLYAASALTYENATLMLFALPMFLWPIYRRLPDKEALSSFALRVLVSIAAGVAVFLLARFVMFSGGAVGHRSLVPSVGLPGTYLYELGIYLAAPFHHLSRDPWAWVWGTALATAGGLLLFSRRNEAPETRSERSTPWRQDGWYRAILGVAIFLLGMLPYLLAGYRPEVGFTSQSRVYSASAFGVTILMGLAATAAARTRAGLFATRIIAIVAICLMAVFFADLRRDWQKAASIRKELCASLLSQVPGVAPNSTFLFLDLQSYIDKKAVVFQGVDGLPEFIRILYGQKDLDAYFLYRAGAGFLDSEGKTATASPEGLTPRGSTLKGPAPLDRLIILERKEDRLVLLDRISADEHKAAIRWNGVSILNTNRRLIRAQEGDHAVVGRCN